MEAAAEAQTESVLPRTIAAGATAIDGAVGSQYFTASPPTSGSAESFVVITGAPDAIASSGVTPKPSQRCGAT